MTDHTDESRPAPEPAPQPSPAAPQVPHVPAYQPAAPVAPAWQPPMQTPAAPPAPPAPERPAKRFGWPAVVLAALLGGLIGAAAIGAAALLFVLPVRSDSSPEPGSPTVTTSTVSVDIADMEATWVEAVAQKATPSVVYIANEQQYRNPFSGSVTTDVASTGSGIIIRENGYIITNYHVIEGASNLVVTVGVKELDATVVGADPSTDLAVLKVDATGLPSAELGRSADLVVGQPVVAIGSPFGLQNTVTAGIISALGRSTVAESTSGITTYTSLIQTDAAINSGNSGGALVDAEGRIIGINTLISSTSGDNAGIGFAIPIDSAKQIAEEIIETGKASHPYMGVASATIDRSYAELYGLSVEAGALVQSVIQGSPAEVAGIQRGDVIVRIGDAVITSVEDVFTAVRSHSVGDTVEVIVARGQEEVTLSVTLAADTAAR